MVTGYMRILFFTSQVQKWLLAMYKFYFSSQVQKW